MDRRWMLCSLLLFSWAVTASGGNGETTTTAEQRGEWGNLRGRILLQGKIPARKKIAPVRRVELFDESIYDESLLVNEDNQGLANVVIWLYRGRDEPAPSIHPSYADAADAEIELEGQTVRFQPRVAVLRTSQSLRLTNADTVGHNFRIDPMKNQPYNVLVPRASRPRTALRFEKREPLPFRVSSSIYIWIHAYLVVLDHPYVAVTDENGNLEIKNLPAGTWNFCAWHERLGYLRNVTRGMHREEWNRGRFEHSIKPGDNDLREIYIDSSLFKRD